jgi:hypothetical protein
MEIMLKRKNESPFVALFAFVLLFGAACAYGQKQKPQVSEQRIYCEISYTNFAWGYQHRGLYVDPQGQLYSYQYKRGDKPWSPRSADSATEQELEEKYSHGRTLIRKIDLQELQEKYKLVEPASKGKMSKRLQRGADQGSSVTRCYLFEAAGERYKEVELKVAGDWSYENLAPSAKKLAMWLASLQASVP